MKVWYKNSSHQMDDPEMEYLQSVDCAACAVWEWLKGQCKQRDSSTIKPLGKIEMRMVCRRLGIDEKRMRTVLDEMKGLGWVKLPTSSDGCLVEVSGWGEWQSQFRSSGADAKRKRDAYWKKKAEGGGLTLSIPSSLEDAGFLKEWKQWVEYRRSHHAPIADEKVFFQKQLEWLSGFGPKRAASVLDIAMRNSWQGLEAAAKIMER